MRKLILASGSPRRKELLEDVGAVFEIIPAKGEEVITKNTPTEVVMELALQKAREVSERVQKEEATFLEEKGTFDEIADIEGFLVLGADTVVAYDGKILGKPKDEADAVDMLTKLSGNTHSVYTGVAFIWKKGEQEEVYNFYEETKVIMYPMSKEEIVSYVKSGSPMDKAGAYGIQDPFGKKYIKGIEGDYYNVVGLPVSRIYQELKKIGIGL